jgi:hypothetical protein
MDVAGVTTPSLFKVHEREHVRKFRHSVTVLSHSVIASEFLIEEKINQNESNRLHVMKLHLIK